MDLTTIENPGFLKEMSVEEMEDLAADVRAFLIHSLAKTGGHIASNLGVVELTIAMHYVFDMPHDKIFFDVGHQCYTHKILTGRAKDFDNLRQYGGISGFQKRRESIYDVWEAGHSSTSLSAALGMAIARDLNHEDYHIVPVIGDGALSSGMALEALNTIGSERRKMIIVFNDNNMSISKNVGALTRGFSRLRSAKSYNSLKLNMKDALNRSGVGKVVYTGLKGIKDTLRDTVIDSGIFGEFNVNYLGPVDGHSIKDLIRVLTVAKEYDDPVVVHVITRKGKGYAPCEMDREGIWHGVGPFDPTTGRMLASTPAGYKSWSRLMADTLEELATRNEDIIALTPAMINGSSLESFFAHFSERSFDCGIAEEHTVTMAAGMAISGKRPFVAIYSSFMQRAYDQINHDVCRMDLPVVFGIDRAGLVGADGETHHGVFDPGLLLPLPNMIVAQPKNAQEARDLMYTAFSQKHPFAIRYPRGDVKIPDDIHLKLIKVGTWTEDYKGDDVRLTVIAYGSDVEKISEKASVNQLPIRVINARFFKPLDLECLKALAAEGLPVIVYETDMLTGGLSTAILDTVNDLGLNMPLIRIGIPDRYVTHGSLKQLRAETGIDLNTLFEKVTELLND
ncbi:MAG: 1-deoxy-D-xylulose-5-phosphate synthase [Solobacterium sp.]|nr:1-deoxy-D-xylulose-5-phosphate synthase [Solobacterium sp.]